MADVCVTKRRQMRRAITSGRGGEDTGDPLHPAPMAPAFSLRRALLLTALAGGLAAPAAAQADFAEACMSSMAVAADPAAPSLDRQAAEAACACATERAQLPSTGVSGAELDAFGARLAAGTPVVPDSLSEREQETGLAASLGLVACALDAGLQRFAQARMGAPVAGPDRWTIAPAPPATADAEERLEAAAEEVAAEEVAAEEVVEITLVVEVEDDTVAEPAVEPSAEVAKPNPLAIRTGNGTGPVYTRQDSKGAVVYVVK